MWFNLFVSLLMSSLGFEREGDAESLSLWVGLCGDCAVVGIDSVFDDGEAEACASEFA